MVVVSVVVVAVVVVVVVVVAVQCDNPLHELHPEPRTKYQTPSSRLQTQNPKIFQLPIVSIVVPLWCYLMVKPNRNYNGDYSCQSAADRSEPSPRHKYSGSERDAGRYSTTKLSACICVLAVTPKLKFALLS